MDQITNMLNCKQSSTLPSDIERNKREHVKDVILRCGKELNAPKIQNKNDEQKKVTDEEWFEDKKPIKDEVLLSRICFPHNPLPYVLSIPYH